MRGQHPSGSVPEEVPGQRSPESRRALLRRDPYAGGWEDGYAQAIRDGATRMPDLEVKDIGTREMARVAQVPWLRQDTCPVDGCARTMSAASLATHVKHKHPEVQRKLVVVRDPEPVDPSTYHRVAGRKRKCPVQGCAHEAGAVNALSRHIRLAHPETAELVACPFAGCDRKGEAYVIVRHMARRHSGS